MKSFQPSIYTRTLLCNELPLDKCWDAGHMGQISPPQTNCSFARHLGSGKWPSWLLICSSLSNSKLPKENVWKNEFTKEKNRLPDSAQVVANL